MVRSRQRKGFKWVSLVATMTCESARDHHQQSAALLPAFPMCKEVGGGEVAFFFSFSALVSTGVLFVSTLDAQILKFSTFEKESFFLHRWQAHYTIK